MMKRCFIWSLFVIASMLFLIQPVMAGSNALSRIDHNSADNVGLFDLVVSLDWEPTPAERGGRLQTIFYRFAQDIFMMTEGHHKVRNLYVYTNGKQINTADIIISNSVGRSVATVNGFGNNGGSILIYNLYEDGNPQPAAYLGHTIAHNFGHYAYGLYDEYADMNGSSQGPVSQPRPGDNTKTTIMSNQEQWQWFSTLSDYFNEDERNTAQWRIYASSGWETLVRYPAEDPVHTEWRAAFDRKDYVEFLQMEVPPTELSKPTEGWDSDLNIIYKRGNVAVLVIDHSGSMSETPPESTTTAMVLAQSAAQQFIDLMDDGLESNEPDQAGVVGFSENAATVSPITLLAGPEAKEPVKEAIGGLTPSDRTNFRAALAEAFTLLDEGSTLQDTRYVIMLSDGQRTAGGEPDLQPYIDNNIPIYTIGLNTNNELEGAGEQELRMIAEATGGTYRAAPTALDLADLYAEINRDISGTSVALENQSEQLETGQTDEMSATVSNQDNIVTFRANWERGDNIRFTLIDPNGDEITPETLPGNITYLSEADYGLYTVTNPLAGEWRSVLTAVEVVAGGQVAQEASAESPLSVHVEVDAVVFPQPIAIIATLTGPAPVVNAIVKATITLVDDTGSDQGEPVEVDLRDDGVAPDLMPNDGVYAGFYAGYQVDGDYNISIDVSGDQNTAIDTSGALGSGVDATPVRVPNFKRRVNTSVTVTGYVAPPSDHRQALVADLDNEKNWGIIREPGGTVYFQFQAEAGVTYYISTSNLLSWDADNPLSTILTLYDGDGTTEIENNASYQGSDVSLIQWTAEATDTYYVAVSAEGQGTGNFALTVGENDVVTAAVEQDNAETGNSGGGSSGSDNGDEDDSSGGCFIESVAPGLKW